MKTTLLVVLLALSLAANAALYYQRGSSGKSTAARTPDPAPAGTSAASPATGAAVAATRAEAAQLAKVWVNLQSGDLQTLVERLRAAGFSASMIRSIVAAQVNEQFSARRKALLASQEETPFWATQQRGFMDPKTMAALRELGREQTNLLKELLGSDGMSGSEEAQMYQRRQFGNLSQDKLEQLQRIASDYGELRSQIYATANGVMLPEDREKLALLEKEQRADMATLLTAEEMENYELRSSTTASMLRSQLAAFKPTEAEFRAIFKASRAAEEQSGGATPGGITMIGGPTMGFSPSQAAVLDQAKSFLTPERYAELQLALNPSYQMINRLAARLELPSSVAPQVVTLQQDMMKRAGALRTDQSLSTDQRNAQLSALQQEATTNLTNVLGGPRGLEAYKQYGGQWLQSLQPRPANPTNPASPPRG